MSGRFVPPLTPAEMEHLIASCWCRRTADRCAECARYEKALEAKS